MGWQQNGTELDQILEPRQSGDPSVSSTGWQDGGTDLADKYAPASVGDQAGSIGYQDGGSDVGPRFAQKGTRSAPPTVSANDISAGCIYDSDTGASSCTACTSTDVTLQDGESPFSYEIVHLSGADANSTPISGSGTGDGVTMCRTRSEQSLGGTTYIGTFRITVTDNRGNSDSADFDFSTTHDDFATQP